MTLPKTFTLASTNFNNFDTMSFDASNTSLTTRENNLQQTEHQLQQEVQQQPQQLHHSTCLNSPAILSASLALLQSTNPLNNNRTTYNVTPSPTETAFFNSDLQMENLMPGIYLTKDFLSWKRDHLAAHNFTHVIIIDKHIQELYYPNQQPDIFKLCSRNTANPKRCINGTRNVNSCTAAGGLHDDSSSLNAFDYYCPAMATKTTLNFGNDFEVINLNFGEKSYLTTVLPNCYKAVKFINKALQSNGKILVIDCNGGEQKCLTITVAYLMYKHNINFSNAFARLKEFYKNADLDRFYISQLYEYEPILQVQRAQSRGHSCSRELHAAILKRKKPHDDDDTIALLDNISCSPTTINAPGQQQATATSELFNNCNPLNRFDTTRMDDVHDVKIANRQQAECNGGAAFTRFMTGTTTTTTTGGWYNWDDYAME